MAVLRDERAKAAQVSGWQTNPETPHIGHSVSACCVQNQDCRQDTKELEKVEDSVPHRR